MIDDLFMAIRMIEEIKINNQNYSSIYLFSNENISGFTKKISFDGNKVLSVCSSGDQAFNLIFNKAFKVDLFDVNILSKYYFYLKKAAIEVLAYNEFLDFFFPKCFFKCFNGNNSQLFSLEVYLKIRTAIDDVEIKHFWDYLFCHYPGKEFYNSELFYNLGYSKDNIIKANDYLLSEDNYNKLKELLKGKKFNFYNLNLFLDKIPNNKKYDFIYLSNIFDYLVIEDKLTYVNKVKEIVLSLKDNINDMGVIAVSYLYLFWDDYWDAMKPNNLKSKITRAKYFDNDDYEYIKFPALFATWDDQLRNKDALMLYKKK